MSKSQRREIKGAEVKLLAEKCIYKLQTIADHSTFGTTWRYDAETVNKVAAALEIPYRVTEGADTRIGPRLQEV